ncbi:hypothetical protein [Halorubrum sp. CBA1229]|uniref:hypothetical protein n=1 Tax=Halorubrum sp. CBA1229 TaxID=1853699 RepID=UPI0020D03743|nr:hypothetical protein [Halorubrum sp. CBA1229]
MTRRPRWRKPAISEVFDPEEEPDGDALAPHHFYVGVALALFGFASIWPYYPATGAGFALLACWSRLMA